MMAEYVVSFDLNGGGPATQTTSVKSALIKLIEPLGRFLTSRAGARSSPERTDDEYIGE
jgi:hypothetical protein